MSEYIDDYSDEEDDDKSKDYFTEEIEVKEKEPKKVVPKYNRDDPRYWEQPESKWEHLKPSHPKRLWLYLILSLVVAGLLIFVWLRYFSPYMEMADEVGYVEKIECRGTVFKTYEGTMLPYRELRDNNREYTGDFVFSAKDVHLATRIKEMIKTCKPVRLHYKKYHATLPWRGESKCVVIDMDTVSPDSILPPHFTPKTK